MMTYFHSTCRPFTSTGCSNNNSISNNNSNSKNKNKISNILGQQASGTCDASQFSPDRLVQACSVGEHVSTGSGEYTSQTQDGHAGLVQCSTLTFASQPTGEFGTQAKLEPSEAVRAKAQAARLLGFG